MAAGILCEFESHQPLLNSKVSVDYVFAFPDRDENGTAIGNAITKGGQKCLGLCRKIPLKDRAMGRADAEITLDGDWWAGAKPQEARALLDHELHHIAIKIDKRGVVRDDLQRPVLQMRKHDYEFGWFKVIAERHGLYSQERIQAKLMADEAGQYFWPQFLKQK